MFCGRASSGRYFPDMWSSLFFGSDALNFQALLFSAKIFVILAFAISEDFNNSLQSGTTGLSVSFFIAASLTLLKSHPLLYGLPFRRLGQPRLQINRC